MKITRIVQQEKQKDRYSVFVDDKYAFSLGEVALLESKLIKGQEIDRQQLKEYKQFSADDKIYALALRYATMRLRSTWEMEQYLLRKQASPLLCQKILSKLSNIGLLNDEAFARSWVANRRLLRPTSSRKLQQELRMKHVPDTVIEDSLREGKMDEEQAALRQLISKKRNLPKYRADPKKLMQYLARQGFGYGDIKEALGTEDPD